MKSKKTKRILSWLLTLAMVIAMMPAAVFAANTVTVSSEEALVSAVSSAEAGDTIKLTGNIDLTAKLVIPESKTFTLDLGEYNITQTAEGVNAINLTSGDKVTITGTGTITGNNNGIYVPSGAELTVNGVAIVATTYNGIYTEGTVVIDAGTLTGGSEYSEEDKCTYYYNGIYTEGTLTVNGGTINAIYVASGEVTVNGGNINKNSDGDSFPADGGTLRITNGTIDGWMSPNLSTTISGGIFNGSVFANQITGGTFNGQLIMTGINPSVSGATINKSFSWWSNTVPTINAGVKFGNAAKIASNSTGKDVNKYKINDARDGIEEIVYYSFNIYAGAGGMITLNVSAGDYTTSGGSNLEAKKIASGTKATIKSASVATNAGYKFDGWYLNGTKLTEGVAEDGSLTNYVLTVTENTNLIATFISLDYENKIKNKFPESENIYTISSYDDMELLAYAVTNLGYTFEGKTVKLDFGNKTLDFSNKTYNVIGSDAHPFQGTFDGNDHTITGITSTNNTIIGVQDLSGLFGQARNATFKNLTLTDCTFNGYYAGGIVADAYAGVTIKNCKVTNVTASGWFSGAVIGHTYGGTKIEDVTVTGCTVSGSKAGNVAGYADGLTIKNVNVSDVKDGAALIGHANAGTNVIEDVTVDAPNAALIDTTYSESSGTITIKGNTEIKVKNIVQDKISEKKSVDLEAGTITVSEPTTVAGGSTITIGNNAKITVEGSEAFAKLEEGAKVDKIDSDNKKTTVTVGAGGGSVDNNANLIIPAGSTVGDKTVENDAVMTPNGTVIEGSSTTPPTVNNDGSVTVPAGGKVTEKDRTETTLNNGGSVTGSESGDKVTPTPAPSFGGSSNTADNVINKPADKNTNTVASTTATIKGAVAGGNITATVDDATADKIIEKAIENKSEKVIIDAVTGTAGTRCEVSIPEKTVQALAEKTEASITIKSDTAEVTFDKKAVDALADQAGTTGTVKLIAEIVAQDENKLQVELKLITSKGAVSDFKGGNVSVTVKPNDKLAAKDIVCVHTDDNGTCHMVDGVKNAVGTYSFNTGHFSSYVIMVRDAAEKIMAAQAAELTAALKLKARSAKTAKGSIKVTLAVTKGDIKGIEDLGYTVKYKFYRSKSKAKSYKAKIEGAGKTYINNSGKKGTKYYYKARVMVYDAQGELIAKTELKQCRYACRIK